MYILISLIKKSTFKIHNFYNVLFIVCYIIDTLITPAAKEKVRINVKLREKN